MGNIQWGKLEGFDNTVEVETTNPQYGRATNESIADSTQRALQLLTGRHNSCVDSSLPPSTQVLQSKAGSAFKTTPSYNIGQLTRLNFTAADPVQAQLLVSSNAVASSYDIIAIQPKTERVLQQVKSLAA